MGSARRLVALMFTDLVDFTSLAQANESHALRSLGRHNRLLRSIFPRFEGREVKSIGDAFLVEFPSALNATNCAFDVQRALRELRLRDPRATSISVRIGVHLGDVVRSGSDILGDSVNVASRVAPFAEPGGVCITEQVFDQVRNKVHFRLEKLPPRALKHVRFPIDLYRIVMPWDRARVPVPEGPAPRLAVLPFANISPHSSDEYFADGLTEEIISVLSRVRPLHVIARTSVWPYKNAQKPIPQIGSELNVGSVLEGSVRKSGEDLRITAQLIDVGSQEPIWTDTFDRKMTDVFAVQAEIAKQVAAVLKVTVGRRTEAAPPPGGTIRPESYLAYLKGRLHLHERSKDALSAAMRQFKLAAALDDRNAAAYSGLADAALLRSVYLSAPSGLTTSHAFAARAVELAPDLAEPHTSFASILRHEYSYAHAEEEFLRALSLNPGYPTAHHWYSILLQDQNRPQEALSELKLAEEEDPRSPVILSAEVQLLIWLERLKDAEAQLQRLGTAEGFGFEYHANRAMLAFARSDSKTALNELHRVRSLDPDDPLLLADYASYYAWTGKSRRARELLHRLESNPKRIAFKEDKIATVYGELGDLDACFRWLERGRARHALEIRVWRLDPWYESVREDSRFHLLLRRMNLS